MGIPDEKFGEKITIVFEGEAPHNFKDLIEGLDFFEKPKKFLIWIFFQEIITRF